MKNEKDKDKAKRIDPFASMPGVYIYGNREIIIDGEAEIEKFSDTNMVFNIKYKGLYLSVSGTNLTLECAGRCVTSVKGFIKCAEYLSGKEFNELD